MISLRPVRDLLLPDLRGTFEHAAEAEQLGAGGGGTRGVFQ